MHVTLKPTAMAWLFAALSLAACTEDKPKPPQPVLTLADASASSTTGRGAVDAHTVALARAARDAATTLAMQCRLTSNWEDTFTRYHDICDWNPPVLEPMRAASTALLAAAPDGGDAVVFIEHVRLFAEWVELAVKEGFTRGALSHYQDLALAWNAFQPTEPIAVDVRKRAYEYDEKPPDAGPDGGPIAWQRCSSGACFVVPHPDKRRR